MSKRKATQFEEALERAAQGESIGGRLASLVGVSQRVSVLAESPPPPPHRLSPGRQRLLAESAHLRAAATGKRKERIGMSSIMKPAIALMAILLVFGSVFGVGQAAADSLPGDSLYDLKLVAEDVRQALTTDLQAIAELNLALAEERLDEVIALLEQERTVDDQAANRVEQQLTTALEGAVQLEEPEAIQTLERLATAIRQRQQVMVTLMGEAPDPPLQQLVREMERVRVEARAGQGDPDGLRERVRHGTPPDPGDMPDPTEQEGPGPRVQPGPGPQTPDQPPSGGETDPGGLGPMPSPGPGKGQPDPVEMPPATGSHGTKAPDPGGQGDHGGTGHQGKP